MHITFLNVHRSLQNCVYVLLDLLQPIRVNPVWSWTLRGADMKRSNCVGSELSTLVSFSTLRTLWVTLAAPLTQSTVLLGHPCGPALWQFSHKMWCQYEANVPHDVSIFCLSALNWPIDQSKENFHILLWYFVGHDFFHSSLKCIRSRARRKFVPIFIIFCQVEIWVDPNWAINGCTAITRSEGAELPLARFQAPSTLSALHFPAQLSLFRISQVCPSPFLPFSRRASILKCILLKSFSSNESALFADKPTRKFYSHHCQLRKDLLGASERDYFLAVWSLCYILPRPPLFNVCSNGLKCSVILATEHFSIKKRILSLEMPPPPLSFVNILFKSTKEMTGFK